MVLALRVAELGEEQARGTLTALQGSSPLHGGLT